MATIRRVVTGHRTDGRSIVASDTEVTGLELPGLPGAMLTTLWGADATLTYPDGGGNRVIMIGFRRSADFALSTLFSLRTVRRLRRLTRRPPPPKSSACFRVCWQPCYQTIRACIARQTVDVLYVVSGRCVLELDDGSKTELGAGDVVVQSGTMHRWHNPWEEPCRIIGMLVGAEMKW